MRTIKFRAWHNGIKKMLYPPNRVDSMPYARIGSYTGEHLHITDLDDNSKNKYVDHHVSDCFDASMTWEGLIYVYGRLQDVELLQFTGYFDRNGKEIFEGDILSIPSSKSDTGYNKLIKREIIFFMGAFCTKRHDSEFNYDRDYGMPGNCEGSGNPWIVIGNKYENPELLVNN